MILDKEEYYKNIIENGFERFANVRDLAVICNKWLDVEEMSDDELIARMMDFCKKFDKNFNYAKSENMFLRTIKQVRKPKYIDKKTYTIPFSEKERKNFKKMTNKNTQRLYFILMCLAKWSGGEYLYFNDSSNIKLKDVFRLAGFGQLTNKKMELQFHRLYTLKLIEIDLRPICRCKVFGIDLDGEPDIYVDIRENILDDLEGKILKPIIKCERCGCKIVRNSSTQKYCDKCKKEVYQEQVRNSLRKNREKYKRKKPTKE